MQYRVNTRNDDRISQLGMGCMRLPRIGAVVDQKKTNELIATAIDLGINFFDTAYIYPGSEDALGKALEADDGRGKVFIATKLPHFMCNKAGDFDRFLDLQLQRLRTDWIDYYNIHMLSNMDSWERLRLLGIETWIEKKRSEGVVRNIGYSFHGGQEAFVELLNAYDWDFCMVQYNYYDENEQAGKNGIDIAYTRNIPVFVMEPVRGGMLGDRLPEVAKKAFRSMNQSMSPAGWAFRWLFDQLEITSVLSGMTNLEQLKENVKIATDTLPGSLNDAERVVYSVVVRKLQKTTSIPCTACGYCMPCPKGVDIPACFSCYNASRAFRRVPGIKQYVQVTGQWTPTRSDASKCVECRKCEEHCPQGLKISSELRVVRRRLWSFLVIPLMSMLRKIWGVR